MGRYGFWVVLTAVVLLHLAVLRMTFFPQKSITAKPDAKVYHITLSRVVVKKPPPPEIPPSPEIEPIQKPHPKPVMKPKPRKKRVHKKRKPLHHKRVHRPKPNPMPTQPHVPQPMQAPSRPSVAPKAQVETATIRARYIALIRQKIRENLYYPKIAKHMHREGVVEVAFVVTKEGDVENVRLLSSPGSMLANGALHTIHSLELPPIPRQLGVSQLRLSIPIEFKLHKGSR